MKNKILSSLLCSVIMLNSYSILADEVVVKPSESTTTIIDNSSTTAKSTENIVENMKDNSKSTPVVNNDSDVYKYGYNYVSSTFYENNDYDSESAKSETTTGQTISTSITDVSKKDDVSLETSKEPIVGTLTPLGVTDESKPVGLLEYLHRLPNTSSGGMKLSVLLGTFVISGLIIGLLYKFSRKIFE